MSGISNLDKCGLTSHSDTGRRNRQSLAFLGNLGRVTLEDGTDHHETETHTEGTEEESTLR